MNSREDHAIAREIERRIHYALHTPPFFKLSADEKGITCQRCQRTSWNKNDVRERFCGNCGIFLDKLILMFVITHDTKDFPGMFAVRRHLISVGRGVPDAFMGKSSDLDGARALVPAGLARFDRSPNDEPVIVETWM